MAKKKSVKTSIDSLKHNDKRANIPTAELQNFVKEDEIKPKKIIYPRDPHLDPQLVWAGKKEHTSFEITTVSLHIHERIAPEAVVRSIKREEPQADLFRGVKR